MKSVLPILALTFVMACSLSAQAVKATDLPADEQTKFNAAKDAAYKAGDASLKEKNVAYKQAYREAMVKADPSVFPIVEKVFPVSGKAQMKADELSPEDAAKYKAAQSAARKADPSIKEKKAAVDQALRAVMIKLDPSIQPIVDKVYPPASASSAAAESGSSE
jgi:3D (Asp-Asp-Asp) domain-containing protein